ncbi:hypothetical protein PPN31114_02318 [Pandoraea pneumonica]|uniref:Uncharacterized protein n=1 Tax=Pandoraea pneumonica TaxID=2508299 RepID=A0A5E4UZM0_9BURK|nr:hypothetical protein PPN31114_02318 [Pandoraea pneumonica]
MQKRGTETAAALLTSYCVCIGLMRRAYAPSFFFSSSLTCAGLALPLVAFIA